jgi:hypothetical protein
MCCVIAIVQGLASRVTGCAVEKIAQSLAQSIFLPKLMLNLNCAKMRPKNVGYFCNFHKVLKANCHPMSENSANLITLLASCDSHKISEFLGLEHIHATMCIKIRLRFKMKKFC